jgi:hypothetical protein
MLAEPAKQQTHRSPVEGCSLSAVDALASRSNLIARRIKLLCSNGISECFHKTVLNEFYRVAFRKKVYRSID